MSVVSPGRRSSAVCRTGCLRKMELPKYEEQEESDTPEDLLKLSGEAADLADRFSGAMHAKNRVKLWTNCVRAKRKIGIKKDGSGTIDVSVDRYVPVTGMVVVSI